MTAAITTPVRHLRPRGSGLPQPTTTVELFFDLVYVKRVALALLLVLLVPVGGAVSVLALSIVVASLLPRWDLRAAPAHT